MALDKNRKPTTNAQLVRSRGAPSYYEASSQRIRVLGRAKGLAAQVRAVTVGRELEAVVVKQNNSLWRRGLVMQPVASLEAACPFKV